MDTLTKISVSNFQSLASAEVELSPGLNCLVGPSNLGKSAFTRAIKALVRNASSTGLVRHGATKFTARATFADGTTEVLEKGAKVSAFTLTLPEQEPVVSAKAGTKAPEDIEKLWRIPAPDGREIAFATQHEPPFLLAEPASAVAKVLGDLTNASILMEAVQVANKRRTNALHDAKARLREAEEAQEELLRHQGLSAREAKLRAAKDAHSLAVQKYRTYDTLHTYLSVHDQLIEMLAVTESLLVTRSDTTSLLATAQQSVERLLLLEKFLQAEELLSEKLALQAQRLDTLVTHKEKIEQEIHDIMDSAGLCPLCGSKI